MAAIFLVLWLGLMSHVPQTLAQNEIWCIKDRGLPACSVDTPLITITITEIGVSNPCAGDTCGDYSNLDEIKDAAACGVICERNGAEKCKAFTHYKAKSGDELCFFLAGCELPGDVDQPDSCFVGMNPVEQCASGGFICDPPAKTPCTSPMGLNHDYSRPENRQWSRPCKLNGVLDPDCDIYLDPHTCQDQTVCTLEPEPCKGVDPVKHTCKEGQWYKNEETEALPDDPTAWAGDACFPCEDASITKEPGLSLFCTEEGEPSEEGEKLKFQKGPCYLYCDGFLVHEIECNLDRTNPQWVDKNTQKPGPFYCWQKPQPEI